MAANVGTPSFFVDIPTFENSLGHTGWASNQSDFIGLNPTNTTEVVADTGYTYTFLRETDIDSVFFLGHDFFTNSATIVITDEEDTDLTPTGIINYASGAPEHDGFSYLSMSTIASSITTTFDAIGNLGAICLSKKYDMPHSPDLNLKLSYEYDGVKTIQTKGGATLSSASYTKPADWGEIGAWQLGTNVSNFRSGRRVWDLSFSYLADTDVMPVNAGTSYAATIGSEAGYGDVFHTNTQGTEDDTTDDTYEFTSNVLDGTDFFSQVWNKTMGGHLPFIFQPNKDNANPDQFAICRFDMNSLTYDQVANNVYNVKLKIRECW